MDETHVVHTPHRVGEMALLHCWVSEGFFPNELGVRIGLGGESLISFVPASAVIVEGQVTPGSVIEGDLRVAVIGELNDQVMIGLPMETLSTGSRIMVNRSLLQLSS